MAAAQFEALEVSEVDVVRRWRFDELVRAGYDDQDAIELAFHLDIDLHWATNLVRRVARAAQPFASRSKHGQSVGSLPRSRRESGRESSHDRCGAFTIAGDLPLACRRPLKPSAESAR